MDTVTHGIVGALIGKAFFADDPSPNSPGWTAGLKERPRTVGRVAILAATAGAIFPDIDVFFSRFSRNDLAYLTHHRGITHSLVMLPVWTVALAALTYWLAKRIRWPAPSFGTLAIIYAVTIGSHIFLDLITSFGIMIWAPLNYSRPALDWIMIVDLTFTGLALLPQLAAWAFHKPKTAARRALPLWALCCAAAFGIVLLLERIGLPITSLAAVIACLAMAIFLVMPLRRGAGGRMRRGKWCRIGLALLGTYVAFTAILHGAALDQIRSFAQDSRLQVLNLAALPMPPTVANWSGLIATPQGTFRLQWNKFDSEPVKIQYFRNPDENTYLARARQLPDVQTFLWFARFPYFEFSMEDGEAVVRIVDLRFLSDGLRGRTVTPGEPVSTIFSYQVVFGADGRLISSGLIRPF